jgi:hypothetical protein
MIMGMRSKANVLRSETIKGKRMAMIKLSKAKIFRLEATKAKVW